MLIRPKPIAVVTLIALWVSAMVAPLGSARADTQSCTHEMGGVEIDGNLVSDAPGKYDWFAGAAGQGFLQTGAPCGQPTPFGNFPLLNIRNISPMVRDDCNGGGSKDASVFGSTSDKNNSCLVTGLAPWQCKTGDVPQKNDLTEAYAAVFQDLEPSSPTYLDHLLFIAVGHRSTDGDNHLDFEFNQAGVTACLNGVIVGGPGTELTGGRTLGDFIVSLDFVGGGNDGQVSLRTWEANAAAACGYEYSAPIPGQLGPLGFACTNSDPLDDKVDVPVSAPCQAWQASPQCELGTQYQTRQYIEAVVNLSDAGVFDNLVCGANSTLMIKSRSAPSFTSELKDWIRVQFQILTPPPCAIDGLDSVCPGALTQHCADPGLSYAWTISGDGTIQGDPSAQCVMVQAGASCGSYTLSLTTTDANNCSNTCEKTVNIVDTTAPVVASCPQSGSIACPGTPSFGTPSFTDNCDNALTVTNADVTTPGACPQEYSVTRTWTATDDCGNSSQCAQSITVEDNVVPTIQCPANQTIACTATPAFGQPTAADNCDPSPTIEIVSTVTNPGSCPQEYNQVRTWRAVDACGNASAPCSQTITVEDNVAPTIQCPANQTIACPATPVFGQPTAADNCDPSPTIEIVSTVNHPGSCPQEYSQVRTWRAVDACGNASAPCSQTITVEDNTPPVITCPPDRNLQCGEPTGPANTGSATATDACGTVTVTFADTPTPINCTGNPGIDRTWTATDACGNSTSCVQSIEFVDNTPPQIICPPNVTVECNTPYDPSVTGTPTVTDNCGGGILVDFDDAGLTPPDANCAGAPIQRTFTATDACGNTSSCVQIISFQDTQPPVISCPSDRTGACEEPVDYTATANDDCDVSPTIQCIPPSGTTFPTGTTQVTCTAVDDCGNSSQCAFDVTIPTCNQVCWLTGGGAKFNSLLNMFVAERTRRHNFGGNVYPGCSPTAGDGGQWNHIDDTLRLHFQGFSIVVDQCGNVPGIPPGSESPVTPFNFIEFHGTGRVQGIKGSKANYDPAYFFARCEDRNEPGSNGQRDGALIDRYFLHVYSNPADPIGSTLILVDLDSNPATVDPAPITDGNLQIHISSCDNPPLLAQAGAQESTLSPGAGPESEVAGDGVGQVELYRPLPNPFANTTRFAYAVPVGGGTSVDIGVYDLAGRRIKDLVSGIVSAGRHETQWDGRNAAGLRVNNGIYFIHATIGGQRKTVSVVYLR